MNHNLLVALLKGEVLPTTGCTEPGAVALAAAYAGNLVQGEIRRISVIVNPNIYKNGVAVGIPGTGATGLHIAAALGAIKHNPERQLSVLAGVSPAELAAAKNMLARGIVDVNVDESKTCLWVQVQVETLTDKSEVVIKDRHTNVVKVTYNGAWLLRQEENCPQEGPGDNRVVLSGEQVSVAAIISAAEKLPLPDIEFLLDGVNMNLHAAEQGLAKKMGMGIGATYGALVKGGVMADDMITYAKMLTAAAADARMSGENINIMSSAGSGNHGITVILPVYAVASKLGVDREKLVRALAISHLLTIYIKIYTGNLSALCGCAVAAATGATAAITWLLEGDLATIEAAMKNVIANLTGMICDGGKVGCALKLSTAATAAVESALLAKQGIVVPCTNGIIATAIEDTIKNLGAVSNPGMLHTDKVILDLMLKKEKRWHPPEAL